MLEEFTDEKINGLINECRKKYEKLSKETVMKALTGEIGTNSAMIEELEKQTAELKEGQEKAASSSKVLLPFMIVTMIVSVANLVIMIARALNLF